MIFKIFAGFPSKQEKPEVSTPYGLYQSTIQSLKTKKFSPDQQYKPQIKSSRKSETMNNLQFNLEE